MFSRKTHCFYQYNTPASLFFYISALFKTVVFFHDNLFDCLDNFLTVRGKKKKYQNINRTEICAITWRLFKSRRLVSCKTIIHDKIIIVCSRSLYPQRIENSTERLIRVNNRDESKINTRQHNYNFNRDDLRLHMYVKQQ